MGVFCPCCAVRIGACLLAMPLLDRRVRGNLAFFIGCFAKAVNINSEIWVRGAASAVCISFDNL